jgi:hypothetical protein
MKKILLAFDGGHYSEGVLEFARVLNEKNPILLTAAFLPQTNFANLWSFSGGGLSGADFIPLVEDEDAGEVKENIRRFESYCQKHGIEYRIHKIFFDFAIPELKKETRFADLLVISSEKFYEQAGAENPNEYLQETLHGVECPVILVPEKFDFPKNNILSYDGGESSVYAIKQFAYLLPELTGNETVLVYANENAEEFPEQANIEELAARHFPDLILLRPEASPKKLFSEWLVEKNGAIVVSGAFGRSGISRSFRKSFATGAISEHRLPIFIAHK